MMRVRYQDSEVRGSNFIVDSEPWVLNWNEPARHAKAAFFTFDDGNYLCYFGGVGDAGVRPKTTCINEYALTGVDWVPIKINYKLPNEIAGLNWMEVAQQGRGNT